LLLELYSEFCLVPPAKTALNNRHSITPPNPARSKTRTSLKLFQKYLYRQHTNRVTSLQNCLRLAKLTEGSWCAMLVYHALEHEPLPTNCSSIVDRICCVTAKRHKQQSWRSKCSTRPLQTGKAEQGRRIEGLSAQTAAHMAVIQPDPGAVINHFQCSCAGSEQVDVVHDSTLKLERVAMPGAVKHVLRSLLAMSLMGTSGTSKLAHLPKHSKSERSPVVIVNRVFTADCGHMPADPLAQSPSQFGRVAVRVTCSSRQSVTTTWQPQHTPVDL
jgi:hypothetical protein